VVGEDPLPERTLECCEAKRAEAIVTKNELHSSAAEAAGTIIKNHWGSIGELTHLHISRYHS
jgi:hypothetical protein